MCSDSGSKRRRGLSVILLTLMLTTFILPIVGLGIDMSMLFIVQSKLHAAVDGACLGAGRALGSPGMDQAHIEQLAKNFLMVNYPNHYWGSDNPGGTGNPINVEYESTGGAFSLKISATVTAPLLFLRILGNNITTVGASGQATRRDSRTILVLDRSGSMSGQLTTLKTGVASFLDAFTGSDELGLVIYGTSGIVAYPNLTTLNSRPYNMSPTSPGGPNKDWDTTLAGGYTLATMNANMKTGLYTGMSDALSLAFIEMQKAHNRDGDPDNRTNSIILFTDGYPNKFTAYLNDPAVDPNGNPYNALKSSSTCRYNPASAIGATQMKFAVGSDDPGGTVLFQGPYRAASLDTNSTYGWVTMASTPSNYENNKYYSNSSLNKTSSSSPFYYCTTNDPRYLYNELKTIPLRDIYGNKTESRDQGYRQSVLFQGYTYSQTGVSAGRNWEVASWNTVDQAAFTGRASPLAITYLTIGYEGSYGGTDVVLLKKVANTQDCDQYVAGQSSGQYYGAKQAEDIITALQKAASMVLRLAQ